MISATVAQLEAISSSPIDKVGVALNLSSALGHKPARSVECYVMPISERATGNRRTTGKALQEVQVTIGVVTAVRALNDPTGERSKDRLEVVRQSVRDALFGWQPEGASTYYLLGNSDLVQMAPGAIWWLDRFVTKTQRQQG